MNIMRNDPWTVLNRLQREVDGALGRTASSPVAFIPPVDIREEAARFVIEADLPGVAPSEIEITADKGILTLRGERKAGARDRDADGYERLERVAGSFHRRFTLPDNVQADGIKARFNHGVLEVSLPKLPELSPRRVQVEAA
ncbi:MAG: hypothetical protein RL026_1000 [Pseudomonadota bacterium]|jgi:HSP20 family protein